MLPIVSIPQAVSTVATIDYILLMVSIRVSIPQAVSTVATMSKFYGIDARGIPVSIPQAVSTVATL